MRQWKRLLTILCFGFVLAGASANIFAQGDDAHTKTPESEALKKAVMSPAFRIYDAAIVACAKTVMGDDPATLSKTKKNKSLKIDPDKMKGMQDCMKDQGINANVENYYADYKPGATITGLDPARAAEIEAMQMRLDELAKPSVVGAPPTQNYVPAMPAQVIAPPPVAMPPIIAAPTTVEAPAIAAPAPAPTHKAPKKYWVTPE